MKITASRLSDGNKVFPAEIHVEPTGITIKIPGLFKGESKYFDFQNIASVDVNAPLVGYSTITIYAGGTKMSAHGFTKKEVKQVKEAIDNGKLNSSSNTNYPPSYNAPAQNAPSAQPIEKKGVDGIFARMLHVDDASMEKKIEMLEENQEKSRESLKNAAASTGKFIGGLMNAGDRKKAHTLHQDLMKITDDIDISFAMNKREEALALIKNLHHTSALKMPESEISYSDYWNNMRKDYIGKLAN